MEGDKGRIEVKRQGHRRHDLKTARGEGDPHLTKGKSDEPGGHHRKQARNDAGDDNKDQAVPKTSQDIADAKANEPRSDDATDDDKDRRHDPVRNAARNNA